MSFGDFFDYITKYPKEISFDERTRMFVFKSKYGIVNKEGK